MGRNSGHGAGPIPEEICARVEALRTAAGTTGVELRPPLLMLGTSERVGSNWLSDTLRPLAGKHNEPFRQQLAPDPATWEACSAVGIKEAAYLGTLNVAQGVSARVSARSAPILFGGHTSAVSS